MLVPFAHDSGGGGGGGRGRGTTVLPNSGKLMPKIGTWVFISVQRYGKSTILSPLPKGRKEMFYLTTHSTHFIYGYMASDIW